MLLIVFIASLRSFSEKKALNFDLLVIMKLVLVNLVLILTQFCNTDLDHPYTLQAGEVGFFCARLALQMASVLVKRFEVLGDCFNAFCLDDAYLTDEEP